MLLTKLENPLFFRNGASDFPVCPSLESLFELVVPLSERGGVISVIVFVPSPTVSECCSIWKRRSGLVWVWFRAGARGL
jgi:hypothetical protein